MSRYESQNFRYMSEVAEWLTEKQPKHWQIIARSSDMVYEFEVIAEFEEEL